MVQQSPMMGQMEEVLGHIVESSHLILYLFTFHLHSWTGSSDGPARPHDVKLFIVWVINMDDSR